MDRVLRRGVFLVRLREICPWLRGTPEGAPAPVAGKLPKHELEWPTTSRLVGLPSLLLGCDA
jgi:hypothetical protein